MHCRLGQGMPSSQCRRTIYIYTIYIYIYDIYTMYVYYINVIGIYVICHGEGGWGGHEGCGGWGGHEGSGGWQVEVSRGRHSD